MTAARWLLEAVPWMEHANCLGMNPDLFFPERGEDNTGAITICNSCQVRIECLDYAVTSHIVHGIWGGQSERQRRRLRAAAPRPPRERQGCGTHAGYQWHLDNREPPCVRCRESHNAYQRERNDGRCANCRQPSASYRCDSCREQHNEAKRTAQRRRGIA